MPTIVLTWTQRWTHKLHCLGVFLSYTTHHFSLNSSSCIPVFTSELDGLVNSTLKVILFSVSPLLSSQWFYLCNCIPCSIALISVSPLALYISYLLSIYLKIMNQKKKESHIFPRLVIMFSAPLSLTIFWHFLMILSHQLAIFGRLTCLVIFPSSRSI